MIVQPTGTRYPVSQFRYDQRTLATNNALIEHGLNLWDSAMGSATSHHIYIGASDTKVMVMRYIAANVTISTGDSITFDMAKNTSIPIPHTVTFGPEPSPDPTAAVGNPSHWDGTGTLSSGVLLPPGFGPPGSHTYTVTFTHAGVYPYKCVFHDNMGMTGTITVQ
ncbi:MAG: cupredoxin domain-containing protein [Marmoricola sp.]